MSPSALDQAARHATSRYALPSASLVPLSNAGGFSGARLWRVECGDSSFCLRAWPRRDTTPDELRFIHWCMSLARGAGRSFVPAVIPCGGDESFVEHAGRLWELSSWMPGRADFHVNPSLPRLRAACVA